MFIYQLFSFIALKISVRPLRPELKKSKGPEIQNWISKQNFKTEFQNRAQVNQPFLFARKLYILSIINKNNV